MLDKIPLHHRLAVYLGLVEIGLGGVFHSLRIPCTGYVLSLHQIFCLNRAVRDTCYSFSPIKILLAAGFLKIPLPSAKTLTPFVPIVMQGILFNVGTFLFGRTIFGRCVVAMLSCVWGFIQPLLIISLVLGKPLMDGFKSVVQGIALCMMIIIGLNLIPTHKVIKYLTRKNYQWLAEPCTYGVDLLKGMETKKRHNQL